jgi:hypothetical protein
MMPHMDAWIGKEVVVTEKMDGEQCTMYSDFIHARSVEGNYHLSRDWVRAFWGGIRHNIPEGWRVCGENMYAKHSIYYDSLPTYFMGFNIWEGDTCFSWDETLEYFDMLGIMPVPTLYRGEYNETLIKGLYTPDKWASTEGYVIRLASSIKRDNWDTEVGKFVRKGHVQTSQHWMTEVIVPNGLRKESQI